MAASAVESRAAFLCDVLCSERGLAKIQYNLEISENKNVVKKALLDFSLLKTSSSSLD